MLVLTRKAGESVSIGDDITVTVLEIDRNHVRIGFDAPASLAIMRDNAIKKTKAEVNGNR